MIGSWELGSLSNLGKQSDFGTQLGSKHESIFAIDKAKETERRRRTTVIFLRTNTKG
jgi:hypothetical protein